MKEHEALLKMVAPGTPRQGKYRQGVIQIWTTRACDKACFGCTQASNLGQLPDWHDGKKSYQYISVDSFEVACASLAGYWGVVGMFGGNPAMHPQFEGLCEILCKYVPWEQRGLWCNNPLTPARTAAMRRTFNPAVSNLNVHLDKKAYGLFRTHWPEAHVVGENQESRHPPPYVAMRDVLKTTCTTCTGPGRILDTGNEFKPDPSCHRCNGTGQVTDWEKLWGLVAGCDINQHWSAMVGEFRGKARAWFCEVAGAQAMIHQHESDYPDTGYDPGLVYDHQGRPVPSAGTTRHWKALPGECLSWWELPMVAFAHQVHKHCPECGVPLRGYGELSQSNDPRSQEQTSQTHQAIFQPKREGRRVELVTVPAQLGKPLDSVVTYIQNSRR